MTRVHILAPLLAAAASLAVLPLATGCAVNGRGYLVADSPPAPQDEVVIFRPGFVFIHGHWDHGDGRWAWRGGYYERERPGQVFIEGRWQRHGDRHLWINGGWRVRGGVVIRDHR